MIKVLKNSIDLFSSRFVNVIAQLGIVVLISRRLGPDVYGDFAFMNAVVMTGTVAAIFGLDTFMVREVSRNADHGNRLLWTILRFKAVASVVVICVIFILFRYVLDTRSLSNIMTLFSVAICLNALAQSFWFYGDGFNRFRIHAFLWAGSNLIRLGFIWLLFFYDTSLRMVIYAIILAELIGLMISYATVRIKFHVKSVRVTVQDLFALLKKGYPMALIFILSVLYFRMDLIFLKLLSTAKSTGYFAASLRIVEFIAIIPGTIYMTAFPVLSKSFVHDKHGFYAGVRKSIMLLGSIAFLISLSILLLSPLITDLLYGNAFHESADCLRILSGIIFLFFFSGYFAYFHMATGNEKLVATILMAAILLKILCNYVLIPQYGSTGAASTAVISELVIVVLYIIPVALQMKRQKQTVVVAGNERS